MARKNDNEDVLVEEQVSNKVFNDKLKIKELRKQIEEAQADLDKAEKGDEEISKPIKSSAVDSQEEFRVISNEQLLHLKLDKILAILESK